MNNIIKISFISIILFLLTACDTSTFTEYSETKNSSLDEENATLNYIEEVTVTDENLSFGGIVVDGYISGATVCLDLNLNSLCDTSEPITISNENGEFSFSSQDFSGYLYIPIIAKGGVDTATNKVFKGELQTIIDTANLSPDDSLIINPLTDLVAISFLRSNAKDATALANSIQEVADVFSLNRDIILTDPMQDITLFAEVQEVQHFKKLIETSATKTYVSNDSTDILTEIKNALVTQIQESVGNTLMLDRVLYTVEIELSINIPENEKTYILAQIAEIQRVLDGFVADSTIDIQNLDRLQLALDNELEEAYANLASAVSESDIEVTYIDIVYESITQSIFSKTSATHDSQACLATNGYQYISHNRFTPERVDDYENSVSIYSGYSLDSDNGVDDLASTEVQLYYTSLTVDKANSSTIVFEDNYTFSFNQAWIENPEHTIYIRTPKDSQNLYGCYKAELNSKLSSEIVLTKVYSYTDI